MYLVAPIKAPATNERPAQRAGSLSTQANGDFKSEFAQVNGVRIHYWRGGSGSPGVLLHGFGETGHMWQPVMPLLAQHHTVIVPDLRGAGDSSKPEGGYDKKTMAVDIHELMTSLKLGPATVVGHDIGLMCCLRLRGTVPARNPAALS